jgi:hypothetical protein
MGYVNLFLFETWKIDDQQRMNDDMPLEWRKRQVTMQLMKFRQNVHMTNRLMEDFNLNDFYSKSKSKKRSIINSSIT